MVTTSGKMNLPSWEKHKQFKSTLTVREKEQQST